MLTRLAVYVRGDKHLKDLLHGASLMYIAGIFSIGFTFLQQVTTAIWIGPEDYGRFAAIVATTTLVLWLVDFRTWEAATKVLARHPAEKKSDETASMINWLILVDLATGLIGGLILVLLGGVIANVILHAPESSGLIYLYALSLPFRLFGRGVPLAIIRFQDRFDWLSIKSIIFAMLRFVLISGAALLGFGLTGVLVGALLSEVIHALILLWMLFLLWYRNNASNSWRFTRPAAFGESMMLLRDLWISATLIGIQSESFVPLLSVVATPAQVGLYRVSLDIAQLLTRLTEPFSIVIQASVLKIYDQRTRPEFIRYIGQSTLIISAIIVPCVLGVIFLGPVVFPVLLEEYEGVAKVTAILAVGLGVNAIMVWIRPASIAMNILKYQNIISTISIVGSLVGLLFLAGHSAIGAATVMTSFLIGHAVLSFLNLLYRLRQDKP